MKALKSIGLFGFLVFACYYWADKLPFLSATYILIHGLPSLLIIWFLFRLEEKEVIILKVLFTFLTLFHIVFQIYMAIADIAYTEDLNRQIERIYIFCFYLSFIFLFKKLGSGLYTGRKSDWYLGLPVGLFSFLTLIILFSDSLEKHSETGFLLFSAFLSFFMTMGVNTPLPRKSYVILLAGLFLNFTCIIAGLFWMLWQNNTDEYLITGLQETSYFCLLYAFYEIGKK